jgi:ATP-dependent RNA helicase RhlB
MEFTELNLNEKLLKGIHDTGFTTCMPVQADTLVHTLKGRDAFVQSQTGTGKTAAFLITIFQLSLAEEGSRDKKRALIIAPTRELAVQIEKDAKLLGRHLDFTVGCFYGGVGYNTQERLLKNGVDIMIGTPGRLLDFAMKRKLDLNSIGFLVIDEADRLFDMGFLPDIRRIVDSMSRNTPRQTMLFSATLDVRTRAVAREYLQNPVRIEIEPEQVTVDKITQIIYHVAEREKTSLMLGILKKEVPRSAMIFTNMKHTAAKVARQLEHNGYKCQYLSGDLPQSKRLRIIQSFKEGKLPLLVATDVAARGLHIDDLELIINYDLPGDCENYVHRIGRTARAGKSGKAISLACEHYVYNLEAIEEYIGVKIPIQFAEDDLYHEDKAAGMDFSDLQRGGRGSRGKSVRDKSTRTSKGRKGTKGPRKKTGAAVEGSRKTDGKKKSETDARKRKTTGKPASADVKKTKSAGKKEQQKKQYKDKRKDHLKEQADRKHPEKKRKKVKSTGVGKAANMEDRLEYYRKKYGDNFKVKSSSSEVQAKKFQVEAPRKSILKRIAGIFKRK